MKFISILLITIGRSGTIAEKTENIAERETLANVNIITNL